MNISFNNINNISFSSGNKYIRKADDIQRKARQTFPTISKSYIDLFYHCTQPGKNNYKAQSINNNIADKIDTVRKISANPQKYKMIFNASETDIPYAPRLKGIRIMKAGNCEEESIAVLAALCANGYYDSKRMLLKLKTQYINKETGKVEYESVDPVDHSFIMTSLDKENPKDKDYIVIDPWLGFTESYHEAKAKYKQVYDETKLEDILSKNRSLFRLNKKSETGEFINFDDYNLKTEFIFSQADDYGKEDMKKLGEYSRFMYNRLLLKSNATKYRRQY